MKIIELDMIQGERSGSSGSTQTVKVAVDADQIRNIHPRKYGYLGTRIVFKNGSGWPVFNEYSAVLAAWSSSDVGVISVPVMETPADLRDDEGPSTSALASEEEFGEDL